MRICARKPSTPSNLRRCALPDGRLPRYIELETGRPLYMQRRGKVYTLTHDDSDLPSHYGWKVRLDLDEITERPQGRKPNAKKVRKVLDALDAEGRWVSVLNGRGPMVGQPKFDAGDRYLSSAVFIENVETLCEWLAISP